MPTLVVLRHAKAETGFGLADIDRALANRGRRNAAAAGAWLHTAGIVPELVLCSPAKRTRETLDHLGLTAGVNAATVSYEPAIYDNDVDALLDLIRQTPDTVRTLLLIGHNPSFHELVKELTGDAPQTFPTSAIAVLELDADWAQTGPASGRRTTYWTPKTG